MYNFIKCIRMWVISCACFSGFLFADPEGDTIKTFILTSDDKIQIFFKSEDDVKTARIAWYSKTHAEKLKDFYVVNKKQTNDSMVRLRLFQPFYHKLLPRESRDWMYFEACVSSDFYLESNINLIGSAHRKLWWEFEAADSTTFSMDFIWNVQVRKNEHNKEIEKSFKTVHIIPYYVDEQAYYVLTYQKNTAENDVLYSTNDEGQLFLTCEGTTFLNTPAFVFCKDVQWNYKKQRDNIYMSSSDGAIDMYIKINFEFVDKNNNKWILSWKKIPKLQSFKKVLINEA